MKQGRLFEGILAVTTMAIVFFGCASGTGEESEGESPGPSATELTRGATLFRDQGCPVCHGDSGQGVEEAGPALRDLAPYWNVERLGTYLQDPTAFRQANPDFEQRRDEEFMLEMPAYDALSEEQRKLLAGWLMER